MPNHVVVIGSINVDSILHIQRLPQPGETIKMDTFSQAAGGKGANQAVAAARSGAKTSFIGRVGDDANAAFMRGELVKNQIDTQYVATTVGTQTGQAYILLQASGQNSIIIQHGANFEVTPADVQRAADLIQSADFVVAEFETPVDATAEAFKIAKAAGKMTILNPAPAQKDLPAALLKNVDLIAPNETESELITGIPVVDEDSMRASAAYYHELGIRGVIITLGSKAPSSRWMAKQPSCQPLKSRLSIPPRPATLSLAPWPASCRQTSRTLSPLRHTPAWRAPSRSKNSALSRPFRWGMRCGRR